MAHYKGEQKIADQVVYEGDVENVEINDEVIRTYCEVIGIDYDKEKELLWIAEEGMRAPIPNPWKACRDTNSDELYYFNFKTGESQWDHPLDEFYSKKVVEEREQLKSKSRGGTSGRNLTDHQSPIESRTQPFPGPIISGQARSHSSLANTLPPDAKVNMPTYSSPSPVKEDGKRFLKSSKKLSEENRFGNGGAREENLMLDLDEPINTPPPQHLGSTRQESAGYEDDYDEDVDFGDGEDRHLSVMLLEKESTLEPELANLASTGEHETGGTSQFSQGAGGDTIGEPQTNNSGPMSRPRNPLAESTRVGQSMTATSLDTSEFHLGQRDPAELEARLKAEYHNVQLELLEEHDAKIRQVKDEFAEKYAKEEAQLKQDAADKIQKMKLELAADIQKESALREEKARAVEKAKLQLEEEMRQQLDELQVKASQAVESERKLLENREEEITKRLAATRADIDGEVNRRLGAERTQLESEYAVRVAVLRKELSALHESEMAKLKTELEEANYREQEAKRAEVRTAEQRVSSVRVLESEMVISLDRRRAELHEEHEQLLTKIRQEQERAIDSAKHDAEFEINKARADAHAQVEEARRKISEETERLLTEARADGERARSVALARMTGLEDGLKNREERVAKRQRELDELERRLNEKERQVKAKQDELKRTSDDVTKEESAIANQKAALEKKRAELTGIQRSIAVDELINQHAQKSSRKGSAQKSAHGEDRPVEDGHSIKSVESSSKDSSSNRIKRLKKTHNKRTHNKHTVEESGSSGEEEEEEEEEEDPTTVEQTSTAGPKRGRKGKGKSLRVSDLLPQSSCSESDGADDSSGLGRNGQKVRKMLLNLLFPNQKSSGQKSDDENAGHTSNSTSSRHSKSHKEDASAKVKKRLELLSPPLFKVDLSDDDSDIDLNEIRSKMRSEQLRAIHVDQRNLLQGNVAEQTTLPNDKWASPSNTVDYHSYFPQYNIRSTGDVDRYLAARWYQLHRSSAYSSPLRSGSSWQWPLASMSTKYGYVPARDLLTQYSANKLANSNNTIFRIADAATPTATTLDYSKSVVR